MDTVQFFFTTETRRHGEKESGPLGDWSRERSSITRFSPGTGSEDDGSIAASRWIRASGSGSRRYIHFFGTTNSAHNLVSLPARGGKHIHGIHRRGTAAACQKLRCAG